MTDLQDLTAHLLHLQPELLSRATEHPFLRAAGNGTLPTRKLREWLAQDVHYTRAYVRFMGGLVSRLNLEWAVRLDSPDGTLGPTALQHSVFSLLTDAIVGIRREMAFFQDVDEKYSLGVTEHGSVKQTRATRGYIELFEQWTGHGAGSHHWQPQRQDNAGPDEQLLYGLVCLWATEMCYLRAWSFAGQIMRGEVGAGLEKSKSGSSLASLTAESCAAATAALQEQLIPNWSSTEFSGFVDECASVANAYARDVDQGLAQSSDAKRTVVLENCRSVYLGVLELEESFWPTSRRYSTDSGS